MGSGVTQVSSGSLGMRVGTEGGVITLLVVKRSDGGSVGLGSV